MEITAQRGLMLMLDQPSFDVVVLVTQSFMVWHARVSEYTGMNWHDTTTFTR